MKNTKKLTRMALIIALLAILAFTPLGFIMVPPVAITIMHIPVIVGSILLGPVYGGILGLSFGIMSMLKATFAAASPGDILFSPMLSGAPIQSIIMCIVPRVILGVLPPLLYGAFKRTRMNKTLSIGISAGLSSICHTFLVLFCIMIFFKGVLLSDIFAYIIGVNGLLETILAILVAAAVCKPLIKLFSKES